MIVVVLSEVIEVKLVVIVLIKLIKYEQVLNEPKLITPTLINIIVIINT